jgi:hypothetical protein
VNPIVRPGITKKLKAAGVTLLLCGASNGRGKVCDRYLDLDTLDWDTDDQAVAEYPKHGKVVSSDAEFHPPTMDRGWVISFPGKKGTVYFHPIARRSQED